MIESAARCRVLQREHGGIRDSRSSTVGNRHQHRILEPESLAKAQPFFKSSLFYLGKQEPKKDKRERIIYSDPLHKPEGHEPGECLCVNIASSLGNNRYTAATHPANTR